MLTDQLQTTVNTLLAELVGANIASIAEELRNDAEGKLTVSIPLKLSFIGQNVTAAGQIQWARRFKDEAEATFELDDPDQAKLSIIGPDGEASPPMAVAKFSRAARKIAGKA